MAGLPWDVLMPKRIGVVLTGELNGWTAPKDVILKLAGLLTVSGGTNSIIEYIGEGTRSISCTGKATITNMGAELGATTSMFPYDKSMADYLVATNRPGLAEVADKYADMLRADAEVEADPDSYFDQVVRIDLSTLGAARRRTALAGQGASHIRACRRSRGRGQRVHGRHIGGADRFLHELILRRHEPRSGTLLSRRRRAE